MFENLIRQTSVTPNFRRLWYNDIATKGCFMLRGCFSKVSFKSWFQVSILLELVVM